MLDKIFGICAAIAEGTTEAAAAAGEDAAAEMTSGQIALQYLFTFAPIILIFVIFWFMMIRPQRKKDKQVNEMLNNLKAGDRICTIGGIYGTITGVSQKPASGIRFPSTRFPSSDPVRPYDPAP